MSNLKFTNLHQWLILSIQEGTSSTPPKEIMEALKPVVTKVWPNREHMQVRVHYTMNDPYLSFTCSSNNKVISVKVPREVLMSENVATYIKSYVMEEELKKTLEYIASLRKQAGDYLAYLDATLRVDTAAAEALKEEMSRYPSLSAFLTGSSR